MGEEILGFESGTLAGEIIDGGKEMYISFSSSGRLQVYD